MSCLSLRPSVRPCVLSRVRLLRDPHGLCSPPAHSVGFSWQGSWSGLPARIGPSLPSSYHTPSRLSLQTHPSSRHPASHPVWSPSPFKMLGFLLSVPLVVEKLQQAFLDHSRPPPNCFVCLVGLSHTGPIGFSLRSAATSRVCVCVCVCVSGVANVPK